MDKQTNITLIIIASVIILAAFFYFVLHFLNQKAFCTLEYPMYCADPEMAPNGFMITLGNEGKDTVYIQDIMISQKGDRCVYLRPEIIDLSKDYHSILVGGRAVSFLTDSSHPDGQCLQEGLAPGKFYDFDIEIAYFINETKFISKGHGRTYYFEESIIV